jgi:hypothetical protein
MARLLSEEYRFSCSRSSDVEIRVRVSRHSERPDVEPSKRGSRLQR